MLASSTDRIVPGSNNFDFLRFFLAALVIFSHSYPLFYGSKDWEPLYRLSGGQVETGAVAVDGFFVISGFLIAQSWIRGRGLTDFVKKRFLRIYPGFAIALLFCILVVGPLAGVNLATYFRNQATFRFFWSPLLLWNVLIGLPGAFLHNPFPAAVNGSLWTIPYELKCYAMVAMLGLLGMYRRREAVLALFLIAFSFYNLEPYLHLRHFHALLDREYLPRLITFYLAGVVAFLYQDELPHSRWLLAVSLLALAMSLRAGLSLTLPIFGSYLLLYTAFSKSLRLENFGRRGDISYGVYLYAFPVQQLLVQRWQHSLNPLTLFLLALPCTCLLATFSWRCVEQPFLKKKRQIRNENDEACIVSASAPAEDKRVPLAGITS